MTVTEHPERVRAIAAAKPDGPPPMMVAVDVRAVAFMKDWRRVRREPVKTLAKMGEFFAREHPEAHFIGLSVASRQKNARKPRFFTVFFFTSDGYFRMIELTEKRSNIFASFCFILYAIAGGAELLFESNKYEEEVWPK